VEELELELEEANSMRQQLEAALAAAAEEVATTRARVEEVLPLELDEVVHADGTDPYPTPIADPMLDSDDNSEDELEPELTVVKQWSQLWGTAKAKAEATAKAAKVAAKAAGKTVVPARDWDLETFRRVETMVQRRRAEPVTSQAPIGKPFDKGKKGPIQHPRTGLAGAVQFWVKGSQQNVVVLLLKLIRSFGVEASVREQLGRREVRTAETYAWMVSRAREFIQASKPCSTAEQVLTIDYLPLTGTACYLLLATYYLLPTTH
jgi:hypothetical protein